MTDDVFEGSLVLEQLNEAGRLDDFHAAVDSDDAERARAIMKTANIDRAAIEWVIEEME